MTQVPPESTPWHRAGADPKPVASGEQVRGEPGRSDGRTDTSGMPDTVPGTKPASSEAHPDEAETPDPTRDDRRPG